jgi:hypothetical protein
MDALNAPVPEAAAETPPKRKLRFGGRRADPARAA